METKQEKRMWLIVDISWGIVAFLMFTRICIEAAILIIKS